jgi:hypothetical protein
VCECVLPAGDVGRSFFPLPVLRNDEVLRRWRRAAAMRGPEDVPRGVGPRDGAHGCREGVPRSILGTISILPI